MARRGTILITLTRRCVKASEWAGEIKMGGPVVRFLVLTLAGAGVEETKSEALSPCRCHVLAKGQLPEGERAMNNTGNSMPSGKQVGDIPQCILCVVTQPPSKLLTAVQVLCRLAR